MSRPLGLLNESLYELLRDSQWHDREPVLRAAARTVTPGAAVRQMQRARAVEQGRRKSPPPQERQPPWTGDVLAGQRRKALLAIHSNRRIERRTEDGVKQVRLRPRTQRRRGPDGRFVGLEDG